MINIFSHFMDCLFTLFIVSFCAQKLCFCCCFFFIFISWRLITLHYFFLWFVFQKSISSIFVVVSCAFDTISKKSLPNPVSWSISPVFSSKSFIVLALLFRFLIHFEWIFVYGIRLSVKFHAYACDYLVFPASKLERLTFPIWIILIRIKNYLIIHASFISSLSILFHWPVCLSLSQNHKAVIIVALFKFWHQEVWVLQLCFFQVGFGYSGFF